MPALLTALAMTWAACMADDTAKPEVVMQAGMTSSSVSPGSVATLAVRFTIPAGWHIYWVDAGEAGVPTELKIKSPSTVKAGEPRWSRPVQIADPAGTVTGYERHALVLIPLRVSKEAQDGAWLDLTVEGSWLICRKVCHLGSATQSVRLHVDDGPSRRTAAADWSSTVSMPKSISDRSGTKVIVDGDAMTIEGPIAAAKGPPAFIPRHVPGMEYGPAVLEINGGRFQLRVPYQHRPGDALGHEPRIRGLLTIGTRAVDPCWTIDQTIAVPSPHKEGVNP